MDQKMTQILIQKLIIMFEFPKNGHKLYYPIHYPILCITLFCTLPMLDKKNITTNEQLTKIQFYVQGENEQNGTNKQLKHTSTPPTPYFKQLLLCFKTIFALLFELCYEHLKNTSEPQQWNNVFFKIHFSYKSTKPHFFKYILYILIQLIYLLYLIYIVTNVWLSYN